MPSMMENVSTINSFLRTTLVMLFLAVSGGGGFYAWQTYTAKDREVAKTAEELQTATNKLKETEQALNSAQEEIVARNATIAAQDVTIKVQEENIEKLETSMSLLKVDKRLARITAIDQGTDGATGKPFTLVEFVELDESGEPLDTPRQFRLQGNEVYVDFWVVKFDDKYIEAADLERSTSICLFRRLFGNEEQPEEGFPLDQVGSRPSAYGRGPKMTEFEKKIWSDFWNIANNEMVAEELGIRAAHGQAVSMKMQKGKSYRVQLRASDGLSILPDTGAPAVKPKTPEA